MYPRRILSSIQYCVNDFFIVLFFFFIDRRRITGYTAHSYIIGQRETWSVVARPKSLSTCRKKTREWSNSDEWQKEAKLLSLMSRNGCSFSWLVSTDSGLPFLHRCCAPPNMPRLLGRLISRSIEKWISTSPLASHSSLAVRLLVDGPDDPI